MTDIGSALLQAIIDEPEDDTHRLVYADWLEGEVDTAESRARAEFIRVQIRLDREFGVPTDGSPVVTGDKIADREEVRLLGRERVLFLANRDKWFQKWYAIDDGWESSWDMLRHPVEFRRGFVHRITCDVNDWLTRADDITASQPVQEVTLTTWPVVVVPDRVYHRPMYCWLAGRPQVGDWFSGDTDHVDIAKSLLRKSWPHISFTLLKD